MNNRSMRQLQAATPTKTSPLWVSKTPQKSSTTTILGIFLFKLISIVLHPWI